MDHAKRLLRQITRAHRRPTPGDRKFISGVTARRAILLNVATALFGDSIRDDFPTGSDMDAIDSDLRGLAASAIADHPAHTQRAAADLLASVHEQLAAPDGVGVHYTPRPVANFIAESAIAELIAMRCNVDSETAKMIVRTTRPVDIDPGTTRGILKLLRTTMYCDPACGAGHLLIAAAETIARTESRLLGNLESTCPTTDRIRRRVATRQLHGRDIDADAIAITRLRLAAWATGETPSSAITLIARNVQARDMLQSPSANQDQESRFDVILMNPPYVPTYSRRSQCDHREPIRAFASQRGLTGRLNLFGCFIIRATEIVKDNGVVSLIVPDTFASAGAYAGLRDAVNAQFGRQQWARIDARVFKAQVGSVILTCSNSAGNLSAVLLDVPPTTSDDSIALRSKRLIATRGDDNQILFFDNDIERAIWRTVRDADTLPFRHFATIRDGVNTGPRRMRDTLLDPAAPSIFRRPLIEGCDIDPRGFLLHEPARTILYHPDIVDEDARRAGASLRDAAIFDAPKVVTRQTADSLIAALEPAGGIVALNSVHCISLPARHHTLLPGLTAFLNSPVVRLYYALDGGEQRAILPQVRIAWLRELPVPRDFHRLLACLAPMGRDVVVRLRRDAPVPELLDRIHDAVCHAYDIGTRDRSRILKCYFDRFPRFANPTTLTRRRRSAQVA